MAGKAKLDVLEEQVERLRAQAHGDQLAAILRGFDFDTLGEMERKIVAGADPVRTLLEYLK